MASVPSAAIRPARCSRSSPRCCSAATASSRSSSSSLRCRRMAKPPNASTSTAAPGHAGDEATRRRALAIALSLGAGDRGDLPDPRRPRVDARQAGPGRAHGQPERRRLRSRQPRDRVAARERPVDRRRVERPPAASDEGTVAGPPHQHDRVGRARNCAEVRHHVPARRRRAATCTTAASARASVACSPAKSPSARAASRSASQTPAARPPRPRTASPPPGSFSSSWSWVEQ